MMCPLPQHPKIHPNRTHLMRSTARPLHRVGHHKPTIDTGVSTMFLGSSTRSVSSLSFSGCLNGVRMRVEKNPPLRKFFWKQVLCSTAGAGQPRRPIQTRMATPSVALTCPASQSGRRHAMSFTQSSLPTVPSSRFSNMYARVRASLRCSFNQT